MRNLTVGNINKNFLFFSIPLILSSVLSSSFTLINSAIAGAYLGDNGLAAVGCCSTFISLISTGILAGYTVGNSIRVAMLFGSGNNDGIKSNYRFNQLFLAASTLVLAIVVFLCSDFILDLLNVETAIYDAAKKYMVITFFGLFIGKINENTMYTLNALGVTSVTVYVSILNAVATIIGNIVSVTILNWGVVGIALSTIFANVIVYVFYTFKMNVCFKEMGVYKSKVKLSFRELKDGAKYTVPSMAQQLSIYAANFIISPAINALGSGAIAGNSIATQIRGYIGCVYHGSARTLCNFSAQCVGGKKISLIRKGVKIGLAQGALFTAPIVFALMLFPTPVASLFFKEATSEGLEVTVTYLRYHLIFVFLHVFVNVFHSFFKGIGKAKLLLVLTVIGSVSQAVFGVIFMNYYGVYGIYIGWALAWLLEGTLIGIMYFNGRWEKDVSIHKV